MEIKSPLSGGVSKKIGEISTKKLVCLYRPYTDVARFFTNLEAVEIYECADTGYQFYYPFTVAGDGTFYEDLSKEPLYYIPWKWEHDIADEYIKPGDIVLEQGCATGAFLSTENAKKNIQAFGTEINEEARAKAAAKGVSFEPVINADVTCSFQVLEHIADVKSFIHEAIAATKVGGYVIFSVPNNNSFIKDDPTGFLNMPPHHMGKWTAEVFAKLEDHFPLTYTATHTEHLARHHYRYYYQRKFGDVIKPLGFIGKVINKIIYTIIGLPIIALLANRVNGHTLVVVFKKI